MNVTDQKYVSLLTYRLDNFKKKGPTLYNFRCPFCGDSEKNKHKARGYLYEREGSLLYYCHNCARPTMTFRRFLKEVDQMLYHEYILERLKSEDNIIYKPSVPRVKKVENVFKDLPTVASLPDEHMARSFCKERKLPSLDSIFYAQKFTDFVNSCIPNKLKLPNKPRIVLPFYDYDNSVIGFQGRAIDDDLIRYITIHLNEDRPMVYGLNKVNHNIKYYVVEGPFDSMFLENAVAVGSSALLSGIDKLGCNKENAVFVFDNEKRNKEIVKMMEKVIKANHKIVIWPEDIIEKDINDMVLAGRTGSEIQHIIDNNTHKGLTAELKFTAWKH